MEWASKELHEFYHFYCSEELAIIAISPYVIDEPNSWPCTFQCNECARRYTLFNATYSSGKSTCSNNKTSTETPEAYLRLAVTVPVRYKV